MKRFAWLTDIHLSCAESDAAHRIAKQLEEGGAEAVLIGGDIAEADNLIPYLHVIDRAWRWPIYFVLGNHDFYFGAIGRVRREVREFAAAHPRWTYLTGGPPVELGGGVGLIGEDGWADAQLGDYERSYVNMNDYRLIKDLALHDRISRAEMLRQLGVQSAKRAKEALECALPVYQHIFLLTHVPPFRESCWYNGQISDDQWLPHFTCKAVGDTIAEIMPRFPQRQLTVLCGHTHGAGVARPLPNVTVHTGDAEYGRPKIAMWIGIDDAAGKQEESG